MDQFTQYAPLILVVIAYIYQNNIFVKPVDLEKAKAEWLEKAELKFASLNAVNDLKSRFERFEEKIDKIYECVINSQCGGGQ